MIIIREVRSGGNYNPYVENKYKRKYPNLPISKHFVIWRDAKRIDSFLTLANAKRAAKSLALQEEPVVIELYQETAYNSEKHLLLKLAERCGLQADGSKAW